MEAILGPSMQMFRTVDFYMERSLTGLDAEHLVRTTGKANSILWTIGHIVVGRLRLLTMLGEDVEITWQHLFGKGSDEKPAMTYPPAAAVTARHREAAALLEAQLGALTMARLEEPARYDLPGTEGTLLSTINYFAFHEAYHMGQVAALRKVLNRGMPRRTIDRFLAKA